MKAITIITDKVQLKFKPVFILISVFLFFSIILTAQEGGLFLTNFRESRQAEDQNWAICQDSRDIMLFANRRGVAIFDGYSWELKRLPVIPYTMVYNTNDERVYIGGENGYGFLARNGNGIYEYFPIETDSTFSGIVTRIVCTDSTLWVLTTNCIAGHSIKSLQRTHFLKSESDAPFTAMFASPEGIFVSLYSSGLFKLRGESLVPLITGYMTATDEILFAIPYDSRNVMLGLASGAIHLFDGLEFRLWEPDDGDYLSQNQLAGGHIVNDSLLLFSTIEGGVVIVGKKNRKLYHILNYESGLPENEVYAIGSDRNMGLWISHEFGLTRADLSLPVRNFAIYPGLKGNIISSLWYNGKLYVGTGDGLYILNEKKEYRNVDVLERVRTVNRRTAGEIKPVESQNIMAVSAASSEPLQQERRSVFDRIFGKKDPIKPVAAETVKSTVSVVNDKGKKTTHETLAQPEYMYIKKTKSVVHSVYYEFSRVSGIDEKCRQLVATPNGLLVGTSMGLYSVMGEESTPVVTNSYINRIGAARADEGHMVVTNAGYFPVSYKDNKWQVTEAAKEEDMSFYSVVSDKSNNLWLGAENCVVRVSTGKEQKPQRSEYSVPNEYVQRYHVEYMRDTLFVLNSSGIFFYDETADDLKLLERYSRNGLRTYTYILTENGSPWILNNQFPTFFGEDSGWSEEKQSLLKLFDGINSITTADNSNTIWITDASNRVFRIVTDPSGSLAQDLDIYIGRFTLMDEPFFDLEIAEFERGHSEVNFRFFSPYYSNQQSVEYRYLLSGESEQWSEWSSVPSLTKFLKPGQYTLKVMSRAANGAISKERTLQFRIRPKFIETTAFYIIIAVIVLLAIYVIMRIREDKLLHDKKVLEDKVLERTAEIEAQKKEITSSIEYASRIQHAMLPAETILSETFSDHFILYRPRNIVSGDFYWISSEGDRVYITAADCTGHGVPGAFMSMLGISSINDIINSETTLSAAEILNRLRDRIIKSLKQTGRQGEAADGIDMALCVFDSKKDLIEFAGAYNSLIHFRGPKITEYRGNRMPIGIFYGECERFSNRIVKLEEGDTLYLFTDGFADQFGGPGQSKYKTKNLKLFLSSIKDLPMAEQNKMLNEEFDRWRGPLEQTDDVTIIGFRI